MSKKSKYREKWNIKLKSQYIREFSSLNNLMLASTPNTNLIIFLNLCPIIEAFIEKLFRNKTLKCCFFFICLLKFYLF